MSVNLQRCNDKERGRSPGPPDGKGKGQGLGMSSGEVAQQSGSVGRTGEKYAAEQQRGEAECSVQDAVDAAESFPAEAAASSSGEPYPSDSEQRSRATSNASVDSLLEQQENNLRQEVPHLLETMNRASQDVNTLERQAEQTLKRYRQLVAQKGPLQEDMRSKYGSVMDKARPYFDAAQALRVASENVHALVNIFTELSSQHTQAKQCLRNFEEQLDYGAHKVSLDGDQQNGLSAATVRVLSSREERDKSEQAYVRALREFQEAQEHAEMQKMQIGEAVIRRALPGFRPLQLHQRELERLQRTMAELEEKIKITKNSYSGSLQGLDRINVAMHDARKDFLNRKSAACAPVACPESSGDSSAHAPMAEQAEQRASSAEESALTSSAEPLSLADTATLPDSDQPPSSASGYTAQSKDATLAAEPAAATVPTEQPAESSLEATQDAPLASAEAVGD